ncbi:hypothetical protein A2I96_13405 [Pseudoalteromonas tetraodonis]|uniref:Uncharacterized protein n=1 Tax=Pseudoalteromonas tetraodonis TaxID=43659 RepID=A0ABD4EMR4_9GAMM|nr:hypothetical protein [Pseudoalteromonas spiralis]KYL35685.1 hypothetical protein A2I96_13405 [Pseudoalteromonas spiralis]
MSDPYFDISRYPKDSPTDIAFTPISKDVVPKEYLKFKSDVEAFISTNKVLFKDDAVTREQFYEEVYSVASLCYSGEKSDLLTAKQALDDIKGEVLSQHWLKARSKILINYGIAALIISLLLFVSRFLFDDNYSFYFISLIGTCVGSWLSVAIRTKLLLFDEIRQNISENASPYIRCIFACVLSFACLIMFKVGVIEIKLGGISSKEIGTSIEIAIALGILFGFSEKYLISTMDNKSKKALS